MVDFRLFHQILSRVRFVLVSPSHPGNVGASARAMQAMGFSQLWIVDPEDPKITQRADAQALSSGAAQVLGQARIASLSQALGPTTWSCALSARIREFEPPRHSLESACTALMAYLREAPDEEAAFVFGPERHGLTNEQLLAAKSVCSFDVEEKFSSLNLSQAVQVVAYAVRREARLQLAQAMDRLADSAAAMEGQSFLQRHGNNRETARPARHEAVQGLRDHLIRVAIRVGYLDPELPGRFQERLDRLLARKEMWEDEVQMLRGLCTEIERRT